MTIALILILLVAAGGFALTYLLSDEETFMWRASAGCVIGSAIYGTAGFVIGSAIGLTALSSALALAVTLLPLLLLWDKRRNANFRHDWAKAKGKLQGASGVKALRFFYYAAFLILFFFFFDRAMIVNDQGIFTGGSNNLGDLPFHLGAIFSFTEGGNLPPLNPNFSGTKFSYPFIADLLTAMFMKLGAGVRESMLVQNVAWAFSLLVILESFVVRLVGDRLAGRIAPILLFFSGGLGFLWFFSEYTAQTRSFFDLLWNLPKDYTIGKDFRWGNSLTTLFLTQRSLSLGLPLTLVILSKLWDTYTNKSDTFRGSLLPFVIYGLIAGTLPLIHVHSLAVLFVFGVFLLIADYAKQRQWVAFAVGVAAVAVPELLWSTTGSATRVSEFIGWHFGWDSGETNILWFWLKNTAMAFPLIAAGAYLLFRSAAVETVAVAVEPPSKAKHKHKHQKPKTPAGIPHARKLVLFYIPFLVLFVVSNTVKLAPWEWDNVKVLIYWFVGSLPLICLAIAWLWRQGTGPQAAAIALILVMSLAGALDIWRTVSRQINYRVFDPDAVAIDTRIRATTPNGALFLNAPTYNSPVLLTGRPSFMRYSGHLGSHGIDYKSREDAVKAIYSGGPEAARLLQENDIDYVLISPEERNSLQANEAFFARFPVTAEVGQYKVYKVK